MFITEVTRENIGKQKTNTLKISSAQPKLSI